MATMEMKIPITFEIPDETVAQCLKVIEWWLNEDADRDLVIHQVSKADGFYRVFEVVSRAKERKRKEVFEQIKSGEWDLRGEGEKDGKTDHDD